MTLASPARPRAAYLHGFASSPSSSKGVALKRSLAEVGVDLALPDLNAPSFRTLTYTGALGAIDALDATADQPRWRFVGSSLGGYLAARWASQHPEKVDRLVLLCPAFDMLVRWPKMLGVDAMAAWRRDGVRNFPNHRGDDTPVSYDLIEDGARHPATPTVACPTLIIHGRYDEVVPIDSSRQYASDHDNVELIEVDSDHGLTSALPEITRRVMSFWGLPG